MSDTESSTTGTGGSGEVRELEVAVLGGGFGGVYCAKVLGRRLRDLRIGLVAEENHMVFQPMLPEVAGGSLAPRHVVNPIRLLCRGVEVYRGRVTAIDPAARTFRINAGAFTPDIEFSCRHLVLALGAAIDLSRIPGMAEHGFLMQNVGDAMKLRAGVIARMEEANLVRDRGLRRRLLSIVVVGGGYSGVETAGQLADLAASVGRFYRGIERDDVSVTLVHSQDVLLPTLSRKLGEYTRRCLEEMGVRVVLGCRVKAVTANRVVLNDGSELAAGTVVCTVGTSPNPLIAALGAAGRLPCERGRVRTDERCAVAELEGVWAVGDCAVVPHPDGGQCPPTAQFAMRQGVLAGRNIVRVFRGDWLRPFAFRGLGELATIGHHRAVANVMGFHFSGFFAWWVWRTVYLAKLPGLDRKLRVVIEWTLDVFFPRDINLLTPRYSSPVEEMYLEAGDPLFRAGEPAFSFYVIRGGRVAVRDRSGTEVRSIGPGGHLGERALLSDKVWQYDAVAVEPTTLVALSDAVFQKIMAGCGSVGELMGRSAASYRTRDEIAELVGRIPERVRGRSAGEVMRRDPVVVPVDSTAREVLAIIARSPHGSYPVVDPDGRVTGVLRRGRFYDWITSGGYAEDARFDGLPVDGAQAVPESASIPDVLEFLVRGQQTTVFVTDGAGRLAGVLALHDLLAGPGPTGKPVNEARTAPAGP